MIGRRALGSIACIAIAAGLLLGSVADAQETPSSRRTKKAPEPMAGSQMTKLSSASELGCSPMARTRGSSVFLTMGSLSDLGV